MKIRATGRGGFSGRSEHYEIDTGCHAHGAALDALVRQLDFAGAAAPASLGADIGHWHITVDDGTRRHSASFAEDGSAAAAPWQALLATLRTLA
ncbi:MAG: hypothetical protein QFF03_19790 [Pseudomonadota bacterium]|nr:hypothetical protein [Pseudomonadota bacterium]